MSLFYSYYIIYVVYRLFKNSLYIVPLKLPTFFTTIYNCLLLSIYYVFLALHIIVPFSLVNIHNSQNHSFVSNFLICSQIKKVKNYKEDF